jgi:2,5-diamino-6-(ribosylamino)-4(3H)-pyrimidinone 5'-phosphate reductase
MLPHVIMHIGVSLDGRIDWGSAPDSLYYEVISSFKADVDLAGSGTMAVANLPDNPQIAFGEAYELWMSNPSRPLLAVVDSRGRIRNWHLIQKQPWWRTCVALCSETTPKNHLGYLSELKVDTIIAGKEQVDLRLALAELKSRYGARVVRTDCGGILHGVLLRAGLVDEVSVIINPTLVGGTTPRTMFVAPDLVSEDGVVPLKLLNLERLKEQYVWLRYQVCK